MKCILAHDLGTSGNKATLFGEDGTLLGSELYNYSTNYYNGTWAEQDPEDWWKAVCATSRNLIKKTGFHPTDIAAISFSGQMMGCLCVDKEGIPLRKSIIWADQRAQDQVAALGKHISMQDFYHITGHRNSASYGIQKLMWVRDNEPEIYANTYKSLNAKDYIVLKLTGKFYTEPTDGAGNACLDLKTLQWSEKILEYAGINPDKLPEVRPSTFIAGGVTPQAAVATGLAEGTPVVLGGGDGMCANVGAGSIRPGRTFSSLGSSAWIASTTQQPLFDEEMRIVIWPHIVPGMYAPNGAMQSAGSTFNWLKNEICTSETKHATTIGVSPYKLIDEEIEKSPIGSNGVIFLPYLLGERAPRWNADAKGAWIGLTMQTKRNDILRSVMEGITMNLSIILDIFRKQDSVDEILVIGGGAKGAVWRQMMADIYDARITVPNLLEEATSMGAAVTGGVGVGLFQDFSAIDTFFEIKSTHEANPHSAAAYHHPKELFDECYFALEKIFSKIK